MQVKVMFVFENCIITRITDIWYASYAGKHYVFFLRIAVLPGKTSKNIQKRFKRAPKAVKENKKKQKNRPDPSRRAGVWRGHPFFYQKTDFKGSKWRPQNTPKSVKLRSQKQCFFHMVFAICFLMILGDLGRPEPLIVMLPCR